MSEIKPAQNRINEWVQANEHQLKEFFNADNIQHHKNKFLSDENSELRAALEALQAENQRLDFKFKHYWGRIRNVLQKHREREAAQAKRIAELEEQNLDYWNKLVKLSAQKGTE